MLSILKSFTVAAIALLLPIEASAQNCEPLKLLASLPVTTLSNGSIAVPASVNSNQGLFILAMNQSHTSVYGGVLDDDSNILTHNLPLMASIAGSNTIATIPDFKLANLDIQKAAVLWLTHKPDGAIGVLGTDILSLFDVELDLRDGKLNLFSPDHCPGHVIYWTNGAAAALPFNFDAVGNIAFDAELDQKPLKVALSTLPGHGVLRPDVAHDIFGIELPAPHPTTENAGETPNQPPHVFATLTIGGITILNPKIDISGVTVKGLICDGKQHMFHGMFVACERDVGFRLGLAEISALRMFFAFHEKMLYVTAANAAH